ncbi:hypothetical protein QWY87_09170 [Lutimonas halocynthiae]|uniref:hypothetical protein n=1 Tax=Lutimonas halocynthiae TaxID=1446477 RepID=UPI0025B5C3D2|nr:hypothetical protein [Lutimonas halocynthiae]MDN3642868.1 hypothetical protein [Lutimonas halocynthiae]
MSRKIPYQLILIIGFIFHFSDGIYAQGCSDAGVCTIDSFKPHDHGDAQEYQNTFKAGLNFGAADYDINVFGTYLDYRRKVNENLSVDAKLTTLSQSGNDISAFGLSDIYVNGNYKVGKRASLTLGFKIPLMDANRKENGLALPMDYQSSLGTFDLVLGFGYAIKKLQLLAAIQQPLTQNNNEFLSDLYPSSSPLSEFQSTNQFKRSGDILIRASYPLNLGQKFVFTPSLLPIYHLANDKFTDIDGIEKEIDGSQGLTLNWNTYFDYYINDKHALQLSLGAPFIVRDTRPDGLTRSFVANIQYRINF